MLVGLDHIVVGVKDLSQALESFQHLGFYVYPGGEHPGRGTHNAVVLFGADYLGLIAPMDTKLEGGRNLAASLEAQGEGIRTFVVGSNALADDMRFIRSRGVGVSDIEERDRRTPEGLLLQWRAANPGPANPFPLYFIQHETSVEQRRTQAPKAAPHPNGVMGLRGIAVVVEHLAEATARYHQILGVSPGPPHASIALGGLATVFNFEATQVVLVEPGIRPGPAREALSDRGVGPFLMLLKTRAASATLGYLQEHQIPVYSRARLPNGPRYVVTGPEAAHGAWIQWIE